MFEFLFILFISISSTRAQNYDPQSQQQAIQPQPAPLPVQRSADIARRLKTLNASLQKMSSAEAMGALQNFKDQTGVVPNVSPSIVQRLLADNYQKPLRHLFHNDRTVGDYLNLFSGTVLAGGGLGLAAYNNIYKYKIRRERIRYSELMIHNKKDSAEISTMVNNLEPVLDEYENEFDTFDTDISIRINRLRSIIGYKFKMDGAQEGDVIDLVKEVDDDDYGDEEQNTRRIR